MDQKGKKLVLKSVLFSMIMLISSILSAQNCSPKYVFTADSSGYIYHFQDSSYGNANISAWYWAFGDGTSGTGKSITHQFFSPGKYPVCLTIVNSNQTCYGTYCDTILVGNNVNNCKANFYYQSISGTSLQFSSLSQGNISNWYWQFGDGQYSTSSNPSHTYAKAGYYYVCLSVSDSMQTCYSYFCDSVYINTTKVCNAWYSTQPDTLGNGVHFINGSQGGTHSYWTFGDGTHSSLSDPYHVYSKPGSYQVCLNIYDSTNTCADSSCGTIYVGNSSPLCKANFTYISPGGNNVYFTNYSSGGTYSHWSFGDGGYSYSSNPVHKYNHAGIYMVCLSITDSLNNCYDTYCDTLYIGNQPVCHAAFNSKADTSGNGVHFINTSQGGAYYYWSFGDGTSSNHFDPHHVYSQNGNYQVCLKIVDSTYTCSDSVCTVIYAGNNSPNCKANFTYISPGGNNVYFTNYSSGGAYSHWSFGDGSYSYSSNPVHKYNHAGIYLVCLSITDSLNNCYDTYCDTLYIGNQPVCHAAFNSKADTSGNGIHFVNTSTGGAYYFWSFGDGTYSNHFDPHHVYALQGYYQVCLTISDSSNTCSDSLCSTIYVGSSNQQCQAYFSYTSSSNGYVYFNNYSIGGGSYSQWNFGDGTVAHGLNAVHTYNHSGYYMVCLTIVDSVNACTSTYCDTLYIGLQTSCHAAFSSKADTSGNGVHFINNSQGGKNYSWSFGDGTFSNHFDPHHVYLQPGYYQVCLTISDNLNTCVDSICNTIYVSGNSSSCKAYFYFTSAGNGKVYFSNYSVGSGLHSQWSFGDGSHSYLLSPTHTYAQSGNYQVCLTITDSIHNCSDTYCDSLYIGLPSSCHAAFTAKPDSLGNGFHFINNSKGGTNYYWSFGDGVTSTHYDPYHVYNQPGYYQVCLTITDYWNNCVDSICNTIYVGNSTPSCQAYFYYQTSAGGNVYFANYSYSNGGGGYYSHWSFGDGTYSYNLDPIHNYAKPGSYLVCLTIKDSINNCTDSYCDTVIVVNKSACHAAFYSYPDSLGTGVQFTDISTGGVNYQWSFGDGTYSSQQYPHHVYASPGTYLVCLSITDYLNSCYDSTCQVVVVTNIQPGCQAYFTDSVLSSGAVVFHEYSIGSMTHYSWSFGDGTSSSQQNPTHYYAKPGNYQVCLSIYNNAQTCYDVYCDYVHVGGLNCKAAYIYQPDSSGNGIYFNNTSVGGSSFYWSFGDGYQSGNQNPHHVYANPGYYQVCLTIKDSVHSCTDTYCNYIYVNGCNIGFVHYADSVHQGGVIFQDYSGSYNTSWYWDFGDGSFSTQQNPKHVFANPGTYLVCMSAVGNNQLCNGFYCDSVFVPSFAQGVDEISREMNLQVYPNPFQNETNISFDLPKQKQVLIEVFSITGVRQKTLQNGVLQVGNHLINLNAETLGSGMYFLKVSINDQMIIKKLKIIK